MAAGDEESGKERPGPLPAHALPRPVDVLPHRPPFLLVDEVTELVPGVSARGVGI